MPAKPPDPKDGADVTMVSYVMEELPTHEPMDRPAEELIEELSAPLKLAGASDRYETRDLLGKGGTSEVHRAHDRTLDRQVAVKTLHHDLAEHSEMIARFVHEARVVARLEHPAIVPIHDLGKMPDGRWFLTMKEVRGRTLRHLIRELHKAREDGRFVRTKSGLTLRRLVDTFRTVAAAIEFAHSKAVVHRDLKPDNVMVGDYGEVIVVDWGLAATFAPDHPSWARFPISEEERKAIEAAPPAGPPLGEAAGPGVVVGTPAYMAPEQARGDYDLLGPWSDVWSLGGVLYSILYGRAPYQGQPDEIMAELQGRPPDPFEGVTTPDALVDIWQKAMRLDHRERYEHAGLLVKDIDAWLEGSRARDKALAVVEEVRTRLPALKEAQNRAARTREQARAAVIALRHTDPLKSKEAAWQLDEEAERLQEEVESLYLDIATRARFAFAQVPDLPEAHKLLADLYRDRSEAAEAMGDRKAAREYRTLLAEHDDGTHSAFLKSDATVTIDTNPRGAAVHILRYQPVARRLLPRKYAVTGPTPLRGLVLPVGSYLLELVRDGRETVRYPIAIARGAPWEPIPPGAISAEPVLLPPPGSLGKDERLVSAGWFWAGGDSDALGALPRRRLWVDAFSVGARPVSHREYVEYLNDLVATDRAAEAEGRVPRVTAGPGDAPEPIYDHLPDQKWAIRERAGELMIQADSPVVHVSWYDAQAYAVWLALRTGLPWRLPGEIEREKAARGPDSRCYPWGDWSDPAFHCMQDSPLVFQGPPAPDAFPIDASPYGVLGLAGGVLEWCADVFEPQGPRTKGPRALAAQPPTDDDISPKPHAPRRAVRGGAWNLPARACRAASRQGLAPDRSANNVGFRLCRTWP